MCAYCKPWQWTGKVDATVFQEFVSGTCTVHGLWTLSVMGSCVVCGMYQNQCTPYSTGTNAPCIACASLPSTYLQLCLLHYLVFLYSLDVDTFVFVSISMIMVPLLWTSKPCCWAPNMDFGFGILAFCQVLARVAFCHMLARVCDLYMTCMQSLLKLFYVSVYKFSLILFSITIISVFTVVSLVIYAPSLSLYD